MRFQLSVNVLVFAIFASMASAQSSSPQPSWIRFGGQLRGRVEAPAGSDFSLKSHGAYGLTRARLNVLVKPLPWLSFYGEAQDTRAPGYGAPAAAGLRNPLDLRSAWVEVAKGEDRGFMVRFGRQELNLGSGKLVGSGDWGNSGKTFEIVRASAFRPGLRVDLIAGNVLLPDGERFDRHRPGEHLYASHVTLNRLVPGGMVEPYLIVKTAAGVVGELGPRGDAAVYTAGFRFYGTLPGRIDYNSETLRQAGSWAADSISATAGTYTAGWTVTSSARKPRISGDFTFGSGDRSPNDGSRGFDALYGASQWHFSFTSLIGWRNVRSFRTGADFYPTKNVRILADYRNYYLATTADGLYDVPGSRVVLNRAATSRHVGHELDAQIVWNNALLGQAGAGIGKLFAGEYLRQSGRASGYIYPYLYWVRKF